MRRGTLESTLTIGCLFLLLAGKAEAQRPAAFVGVSFVAADAVGELGSFIDQGFGLDLTASAPVAAGGHLRIRADLGFLIYGIERLLYCSYGCRVGPDLTTTNSIIFGGIGPEVVLATGPIQPYAHVSAGVSYFLTSSSMDDHDGYGPYLQTTNYSDLVIGWKYGGGLRLRLGGRSKPVYLYFGVDRHDNGIANFLTAGDIVDHPDGSVTIYPNRSEADLMTFHLGVSFGIS